MQPVLTRFSSKGVERHLDVGERSRHCLLELYSVRGDSHLHSIHWKRGNKGPERVSDLFKNTQEVFWVQACAGQQSQSVIPLPNSLTGGNPWVTRSRPQRKASPPQNPARTTNRDCLHFPAPNQNAWQLFRESRSLCLMSTLRRQICYDSSKEGIPKTAEVLPIFVLSFSDRSLLELFQHLSTQCLVTCAFAPRKEKQEPTTLVG